MLSCSVQGMDATRKAHGRMQSKCTVPDVTLGTCQFHHQLSISTHQVLDYKRLIKEICYEYVVKFVFMKMRTGESHSSCSSPSYNTTTNGPALSSEK